MAHKGPLGSVLEPRPANKCEIRASIFGFFLEGAFSKFGLVFSLQKHVFYEGVFQNLAFCARVAPNYSQMAPKIHSKWVPGVPNGSQNPFKIGPRRSPGDLQSTIQKKGPLFTPQRTPRGSKKTAKMDTQITKSRSRMNFLHD